MEKGPDIRIIGNASEEVKNMEKKKIAENLFDHFPSLAEREQKALKKFEYPKSLEEVALIDFANQETNRLMQEVGGVEPYDIPTDNFHLLPPEIYQKACDDESNASAFITNQGVLFNAAELRGNSIHFGSTAFHEMLHLKGHTSFEVKHEQGKDEANTTLYRSGINIYSLQALEKQDLQHAHFKGLTEAIISTQESRSLHRMLELPIFAEEKRRLETEEAMKLKQEIAKEKNINEKDLIWVGTNSSEYEMIVYINQRRVLDYVIGEIVEEFPHDYSSSEEIFNLFLKAHFTGQILDIARLIEETFGKDSFRLLGNMSDIESSAALCLESLKKSRARMKKVKTDIPL
ncbi:hypothetical protein KW782_00385 [Candidatus Parcubacteria bacterium]|nr:hypothetical protein [Candidatus Parcubacteria bacterium]